MIKRFLSWVREARKWHRRHIEEWRVFLVRDAEGFTAFQRKCEAAVDNAMLARGRSLLWETRRMSDRKPFRHCEVLDSGVELWIYANTAEVKGRDDHTVLEDWDFLTPDQLVTEFVQKVEGAIL